MRLNIILKTCLIIILFSSNLKAQTKVTISDCKCPDIEYKNQGLVYFPSITNLMDKNTVKDVSNWILDEQIFNNLYYKNYINSLGSYGNFFSAFTLNSPNQPIKLIHPDKTFTLNFSPCKNSYGNYEVPVNLTFSHEVLNSDRDFDLKKFDYSAAAYVHLLLKIVKKKPSAIIRWGLKDLITYDDNGEKFNQTIELLNEKFHTEIPLVTSKNFRDSMIIEGIMDSLVSKKLRQETVLTSIFILSEESGKHSINKLEQLKLEYHFSPYYPELDLNNFNKKVLQPEIRFYLESPSLNIEINQAILHSVDNQNADKTFIEIYGDINRVYFGNEDGLEIKLDKVCLPPTLISGTSIGIDFEHLQVLATKAQTQNIINDTSYPFVEISKDTNSVLKDFTGVYIDRAKLTFSKSSGNFKIDNAKLFINNNLIMGNITFPTTKSKKRLIINNQKSIKTIKISKFLALLNDAGLKNLSTKIVKKQCFVFFNK